MKNLARHLGVIIVLVLGISNIIAMGIGFGLGRSGDTAQIQSNTAQETQRGIDALHTDTQRGIDEQHRFQECLLALIAIPQDQRRTLTAERIEDVCHIDVAAVNQIREALTK